MNEETFNLSIRKFLRMVGVNSQREIEQAVAKAVAGGAIAGTESFPAKVTLAAFNIASAASIAPTSPFVSTNPRALDITTFF